MSWFTLRDYIDLFKSHKPKISSNSCFLFGEAWTLWVGNSSPIAIKTANVVVYDRMVISEQGDRV